MLLLSMVGLMKKKILKLDAAAIDTYILAVQSNSIDSPVDFSDFVVNSYTLETTVRHSIIAARLIQVVE